MYRMGIFGGGGGGDGKISNILVGMCDSPGIFDAGPKPAFQEKNRIALMQK